MKQMISHDDVLNILERHTVYIYTNISALDPVFVPRLYLHKCKRGFAMIWPFGPIIWPYWTRMPYLEPVRVHETKTLSTCDKNKLSSNIVTY